MSKCDIRIEFDRKDRTYTGGDTVTGRVFIRVNESVKSNGITLTHQWKTHGRGNVTSGPKEKIELDAAGLYSPGEEYDFPFSLPTATHPVTYHGTMINVDHYVSVQVDVPWAFNPKAEEDYILVAGEPPSHFVGSRKDIITAPQTQAGASSIIGKIIVAILVGGIVIVISAFALFLLPVILLIAGFVWFHRKALASRLGEVQLSIPRVITAPGEPWTARVQFQPRKQFRINSISLTLLGKESATSGSGTNSTTHTHTILEQKSVVRANDILTAGELVSEEFTFAFPDTDAFSLDVADNKIQWTATLRIDIPAFPDWSKTQALQVIPHAFLKNLTEEPSDAVEIVDDAPSPVIPSDTGAGTLLQLASAISAAPRHGSEQSDMIIKASGVIFDAVVVVDRVISSMGTLNADPRYEYGKSITGTIQGTNQAIQVITPETLNDLNDELRRGDVWQIRVTLLNWDSLYTRINARQVDENSR